MRTNYMMTVDDVMEELGVKRSKAYSVLKQLNDELAKEGYVAVRGKIPRPIQGSYRFISHQKFRFHTQRSGYGHSLSLSP